MKINSEENTEFSGNKGQEHYSSDLSICRGVLGCTSNSAYSANKMLSECTMALDSSEHYSFLVCRSLQGQVADLLREDYRTSNGWALVSYHERGREAVTEHELQSRQLTMAAFTRYLLHAWHAADSRDQLRGINYKLDLLLTRVPSKQGECKSTGRAVTSVNSAASESTSATRESAMNASAAKESATNASATRESATNASAAKESATNASATKELATNACATEESTTHASATSKTAAKTSASTALPSTPTTVNGAGRASWAQSSAHAKKGAIASSRADTSSPSSPSKGRGRRAGRQVRQQRAARELLSLLRSVAGDTPHRSGGAQR